MVTKFSKATCPVLPTSTGLHANKARLTVGEMLEETTATELPVENLAGVRSYPVHLVG